MSIKKIAEITGFSVATVARVLNDPNHKCAVEGTRERILQVAREINRNSTNYAVDEVLCDGKKIAMTAIEHLVNKGHTQVGYVGDCHNETRFEGYQMAQMHYHLKSDIDYIFDTLPTEDNGYKAMEYFLKQPNPPTAIYCANDILAIGMLKCLNKRRSKYYMPSIISSDDIEEAQFTKPMLTTVSLIVVGRAILTDEHWTEREFSKV